MANTTNLTKKALKEIVTIEEANFVAGQLNIPAYETVEAYLNSYKVGELNNFHKCYGKHLELMALETPAEPAETDSKPEAPAETDSKPADSKRKTKELPADAPEVCNNHSSFKNDIMVALFKALIEKEITFKTDGKGRVTTEYGVMRYRKNQILVQLKTKLVKAKPELIDRPDYEIHAGWDIERCINVATVEEALDIITVTPAEPAETAEEA